MLDAPLIPEQIWAGDLFDRQAEAEQLIAYIEAVVDRPIVREDKKAYTIAIDAQYGEGKTYFLKRLAQHLAINHPVAFVDAWADDLADEPLTALAATLKEALAPFESDPVVRERVKTFMAKTGKVARIATLGLAKRAIGLAITAGAVDAASEVMSGASDAVASAINDATKDAVSTQTEEVEAALRSLTSHSMMEERVACFNEGKAAVREMKQALSAIIASLEGQDKHRPIIIVIDELDRCRPTYAIKVLEEIKHLFDVPGLVFVMALHSDQLARSVSGAYGATFDGRSYLRRFVDREFSLSTPPLYRLVKLLSDQAGIGDPQIRFPTVLNHEGERVRIDVAAIITHYVKSYGLSARDTFALIDGLQTSIALAGGKRLEGGYLLPLLIGHLGGLPPGELPKPLRTASFQFIEVTNSRGENSIVHTFESYAEQFSAAAKLNNREVNKIYGTDQDSIAIRTIATSRDWNANPLPLWDISKYHELVRTVGRFKSPALDLAETGEQQVRWIY